MVAACTVRHDAEALATARRSTRRRRIYSRDSRGLAHPSLPKIHRTFGRRRRHMSVGDFSAQCLNGRRQAMILRLRGVALCQGSVRGVPARRKRDQRPDRVIVVGRLRQLIGGWPGGRCRWGRNHRQTQIGTLKIHDHQPVRSVLKLQSEFEITGRARRKRRAHSQIAHPS